LILNKKKSFFYTYAGMGGPPPPGAVGAGLFGMVGAGLLGTVDPPGPGRFGSGGGGPPLEGLGEDGLDPPLKVYSNISFEWSKMITFFMKN
jgi:hypothetical protein